MINLKIISLEKIIFNGTVQQVTLPGSLGTFTVLQKHAPLMTPLMPGVIEYVVVDQKRLEHIYGGIAEIRDNNISICLS